MLPSSGCFQRLPRNIVPRDDGDLLSNTIETAITLHFGITKITTPKENDTSRIMQKSQN